MFKSLFWGNLLIAFSFCFLQSLTCADNTNLLVNPGFETVNNGFPADWKSPGEEARKLFELDREINIDGKFSLKATGNPSQEWLPVFTEAINVSPEEELTLAGCCKSDLQQGEIVFAIREIDKNGKSVKFHQIPVLLKCDWKFYSKKFKMGQNAASVQVFIVLRKGVGHVWFDNLILAKGDLPAIPELETKITEAVKREKNSKPYSLPKGNLLTNNNFELLDAAGKTALDWTFVADSKDQSAKPDDSNPFSGKYSFMQEHKSGGIPGSYIIPSKPVKILPNKNYRLSCWVNTSADGKSNWTSIPSARRQRVEGACLQLVFKDDAGKIVSQTWSETVQTGGQWKPLEIAARAPGNADYLEARLFHGDFKGQSWFDAVRLESTDDSLDIQPAWRLYKDVYTAGKLPPSFKFNQAEGKSYSDLKSGDDKDEYSLEIKLASDAITSKGVLNLPALDASFPGTFSISGEYRIIEKPKSAAGYKLILNSCDVYDKTLSKQEMKLEKRSGTWSEFNITYKPDLSAEHISCEIIADGKDSVIEFRNLTAKRLSKMTIEEYSGVTGSAGWQAAWIWYPEDALKEARDADRFFVKTFTLDDNVKSADIQIAVDDIFTLYINGNPVGDGTFWRTVKQYNVKDKLVKGENVIAVKAHNTSGYGGVLAELAVTLNNGKNILIKTDADFLTAKSVSGEWTRKGFTYSQDAWKPVLVIGVPPVQPWGRGVPHTDKQNAMDVSADKTLKGDKKELPNARIVQHNGVPTLEINGKYRTLDQNWNWVPPGDAISKNIAKAGLMPMVSTYNIDWSKRPAEIDFKSLDKCIREVLASNPDAQIMICPDTTAEHGAVSWSQHNLDEKYVNDLGESQIKAYDGSIKTFPSYASKKWQQDVDDMLVTLVKHVKESDYADHIMGYLLSGYEWFQWEWMKGRIDCSKQMKDAFAEWLKIKYKTAEQLRAAWNNKEMDFDKVMIPSQEERRKTMDGVFRDPAVGRNVIDFSLFYNDLTADILARQGKAIKTESGKNTIVGSFFGYLLQMTDGVTRETASNTAIKRLLDSGWVDFSGGPSDGYIFERGIGGTGGYMGIPGTYMLHNSIWQNEPDFRTHWSTGPDCERTFTLRDDVNIFRREYAMNLTNLSAAQYLDFDSGNVIGDRRIVEDLRRLSKVSDFAISIDRKPYNQEIAVIISDDSSSYIGTEKNVLGGSIIYHQRPLLFRAGMPHRYYLMSDLSNSKMPDYKYYLFPNAFKLSAKERDMIKKKCMKDGNVVVFVYAPGYINDKTVSVKNMSDFLGMNIEQINKPMNAIIRINPDGQYAWLKDSIGITYGQSVWSPLFCVNDKSAHTLGNYTGTDKAGLAWKDFGNYKVVFSGTGLLPPDLLRDLGRLAGNNIYINTSDAIYADKDFLSIHAKAPGVKNITLPRTADVYDLINNKVIGKKVKNFSVNMNTNETALFYIGDADKAANFFAK